MQLDPYFLIGIAGMILLLLAFFMVQTHRWSQDDFAYDVVNFLGSSMFVIYGIAGKTWPFVILNGVWAIYSLKDAILDLCSRKK